MQKAPRKTFPTIAVMLISGQSIRTPAKAMKMSGMAKIRYTRMVRQTEQTGLTRCVQSTFLALAAAALVLDLLAGLESIEASVGAGSTDFQSKPCAIALFLMCDPHLRPLALEQLQHGLLAHVGLSQHRRGGLLHDLRAGQLG